ncbi:MAG: TIGR03617 family F420-dependent LLM class oxidoreductase [Caldilineae bacterium]|nr:MAG: TIGR03617 family F420-dependent LLM class oxidoreductase [Caldilineae bacterium]
MLLDAVLNQDEAQGVIETARAAEEMGFACLWAPETKHDPFVQLALAAQATRTIQVGTAIAVAFARSPMHTAYVAWDLARYSEGRFILGLGTQIKPHIERRFAMPWSEPAARLREYIQALRHIWQVWQQGERLNFRGRFYKLTLMSPFFNPGPIAHPDIPIYIAGVNRRLCELAGELCQGFHVHPFHTPRYLRERIRPWVAAGASKTGRQLADISFSATVFAVLGDTEAERAQARRLVREQLSFYASTPSYRPVLEMHGWGDLSERLGRLAIRQRWDEMPELVPDEMVNTFAVQGSWDELGPMLRDRYEGLLDRITLYLPFVPGQQDDRWRRAVRSFRDATISR